VVANRKLIGSIAAIDLMYARNCRQLRYQTGSLVLEIIDSCAIGLLVGDLSGDLGYLTGQAGNLRDILGDLLVQQRFAIDEAVMYRFEGVDQGLRAGLDLLPVV